MTNNLWYICNPNWLKCDSHSLLYSIYFIVYFGQVRLSEVLYGGMMEGFTILYHISYQSKVSSAIIIDFTLLDLVIVIV